MELVEQGDEFKTRKGGEKKKGGKRKIDSVSLFYLFIYYFFMLIWIVVYGACCGPRILAIMCFLFKKVRLVF